MSHKFEDFDLFDRVQCSTEPGIAPAIKGKIGSVTEIITEGQLRYLSVDFANMKFAFPPSHLSMLTIIKKSITATAKESRNGR